MPNYTNLPLHVSGASDTHSEEVFVSRTIPFLVDLWVTSYEAAVDKAEIVEISVDGFSYLFDVSGGRLIAAWGISRGRNSEPRPAGRMKGHPLGAGRLYHRGHAIPHTLGGTTDINLVPQRGSVNVGPFRELEKIAVKTPGALYFTHWVYPPRADQTPIAVEQGLITPGRQPRVSIKTHPN